MTRPTHGTAGGDDVALWYAQEVMSEAEVFDSGTVAMACEWILDHAQASYADRQKARDLLDGITGRAA